MGEYVGTKVMAELWACSPAIITKWCREGRIAGAEQDSYGSSWRIPIDALKSERRKKAKRKEE